jgi:TRAP transporter 4TM/12TM fusion protein
MRELAGPTRSAVAAWAALATLLHLHAAVAGFGAPLQARALHLLALLPLAFLLWPARPGTSPAHRPSGPDLALALLSILPGLHALLGPDRDALRLGNAVPPETAELLLGGLASLLVVEALRRVVAPVFAGLVAAGILYLVACAYLPGVLHHRDVALHEIVGSLYLSEGMGMLGPVTGISATMVAVFVAFAVASERSGLARFFHDLAIRAAGRQGGGPARSTVIAAALSGTFSGASKVHGLATGSPAIPAMVRLGFHRDFAAGVAASSSAGIQFMPPVMGAGAFVVALAAGIPYGQACLAALLGALIHFLMILASVHFEARRLRIPGLPEAGIPAWRDVLRAAPLLLPLVLLAVLLLLGRSPQLAAFWAFVATFLVSWVHRHPPAAKLVLPVALAVALALARFGEHDAAWSLSIALGAASLLAMLWSRPGTRPMVREAVGVLVEAACRMVVVALACAGAGMLVACLAVAGLDAAASGAIRALGQGSLLAAGALLAASTLVLGKCLPAIAAQVVVASAGAQVLVELGVPALAAHMFVFWFSILAVAMPPASVASIAGADPLRTGLAAARLALAGVVVGFGYLHAPALLMLGAWPDVLGAALASAAGLVLAAAAFSGHFRDDLAIGWRVALGGAAIVLALPLDGLDPWVRVACEAVIGAVLWMAPRAFAPGPERSAGRG